MTSPSSHRLHPLAMEEEGQTHNGDQATPKAASSPTSSTSAASFSNIADGDGSLVSSSTNLVSGRRRSSTLYLSPVMRPAQTCRQESEPHNNRFDEHELRVDEESSSTDSQGEMNDDQTNVPNNVISDQTHIPEDVIEEDLFWKVDDMEKEAADGEESEGESSGDGGDWWADNKDDESEGEGEGGADESGDDEGLVDDSHDNPASEWQWE